ncbi:cytochrome ubiquinol oxidase subunit I [Cohnella cellulosilytica]|uniref:Cytochrome ubiquinol oxidase subunit I n=1 Tax=Cohnella cellulosilytica TaxID=986710 RepID=A0ABW2FB40_9BACL
MPAYDPVLYARILTFATLAFHIVFATVGVGVPILLALAEWIGIRRKDPHYLLMARRWARGYTITVAVGVVTGTAIGLQLSLLWPAFMEMAGQAIALPLFMETFAFFFEAIFLGIYLYTWDRFNNPMIHFLLLIPVVLGSSASAFFITTVNAFMNSPVGFRLENGILTDVQPLVAMFNPATPSKVSHVLLSAYLTVAFILAAFAARGLLRNRRHEYYRKSLKLNMIAAAVFALGTIAVGDLSGKYLAEYQPEKLAAAEWHFETSRSAPLIVGGILDKETRRVSFGLKLPYMLSFLAHADPHAEVIGLDRFPDDEEPPLVIHYYFDLMVGIGIYLLIVSALAAIGSGWRRFKTLADNRLLLRGVWLGGPLAMLAIELGWMFTERGRQPWILVGFMKTGEGATTSEHVDLMLVLFCSLYLMLGLTVVRVLSRMFANRPPEAELNDPVAPRLSAQIEEESEEPES